MRFFLPQFICSVGFVCCLAPGASAQDLVVRSGQVARLHLADQLVTGRIVSIQRDSVYLRRTLDGPVRRFGSGDIQQVDVRFPGTNRQRRTIVGSLVGGAVGVAGGIYASGGGACSDCVATTQDLILGTLLFTGAFSALGGIVGYATTPARWVPAQIPR
jgi:hypothetical protein